ncbi:MAG TPA: hexose kinase [Abditibacteriaceae bacterium]|jgi:1-phosphofructokinase family hexose kinase
MLLTITPNLCIERTVRLPQFTAGQVHRVAPEHLAVNVGGKGINVARVATKLSCASHALSWAGRRQKLWLEEELTREGITHQLIETEADTRICLNVLAGEDFTKTEIVKTEIVEAGSALSIEDGTHLLEAYAALLPQAEMIAICGSYPPSQNPALNMHLGLLVQMAQHAGKRVLVDGKGKPFQLCLNSPTPPWAVKPNLEEAQELLNRAIETPQDERRAVRDILKRGVEVVILSCGARGAYWGTAEGMWFVQAPLVHEVSPVGSGDALVGAFCAKLLETNDLLLAARWGVAAGTANATQSASAFVGPQHIEPLLDEIKISAVELGLRAKKN